MEHEWARMLWAQTWQVSLLIVAVAIVSRVWGRNRPHLAHALWIVVLIKAITPPVWSSPSGVFSWLQPARTSPEAVVVSEPEESPASVPPASIPRTFASELLQEDWPADSDFEVLNGNPPPAAVPVVLESEPTTAKEIPALEPISSDAEIPPAHAPEAWPAWSLVAMGVWLAGMLGSLLLSLARWICCCREIRRAGVVHDLLAQELLDHLLARFRIRRRVRLIISQSRIGPAVLGIFRPTVLIPARIIAGKTPADLEPILAHELVHVRRGDLWVGWLQVLVQAAWWFHPLVWWAGRLLKHEAERCCDEEVIAELGLKPGRYARALLDVLELKQVLRPVPVLPGVKPVEITSKRLERIMLLGQGCRKRTPWWCWLVMLLTAALTLPGAAFMAQAKEKPKSHSQEKTVARTRKFKVGDVLERIQKDLGLENEKEARTALAGQLKAAVGELWREESLLESGQQVGTPSLTIKGKTLTVRHTPRVIEEIARQVELLREYGLQQVVIEARIISVSDRFFERSGMDLDFKKIEVQTSRTGVQETVEKTTPAAMAILDDSQARMFIEACQADERSDPMFCPKVTLFNGQRATIQDTIQRPFVVGVSSDGEPSIRIVSEGTTLTFRPTLGAEQIQLESQLLFSKILNVQVVEASTNTGDETPPKVQVPEVATTKINTTIKLPNGGSVLLGGIKRPREDRDMAGAPILNKIPYVSRLFKNSPVDENSALQLFVMLRVVHLEKDEPAPLSSTTWNQGFEFTLPLGVRSAQTVARHAELEYQKALDANRRLRGTVPESQVERLRLKAEQAHLQVEQYKQYKQFYALAKQEVSDVEVRYAKKAAELAELEYKTALEANRRLPGTVPQLEVQRLKLKAEQAKLQVEQAEHELELKKQQAGRLMIGLGINSDAGLAGQIVLDEKNFDTIKIEPPTDEEVLESARKELEKNQEVPHFRKLERKNVRIIKEKTSQAADPPRMYPKIGLAQQHKAHFKCTLTSDVTYKSEWPVPLKSTGTEKQIVHIDKSVLVPVKQVPKPLPAPTKDAAVVPSAYERHFAGGLEIRPQPESAVSWEDLRPRRKLSDESETEKQIAKQLDKKITLHFTKAPLSEVVKKVATDAGINIVVDNLGLSEEGITQDQAFTIDVKDVKLSSALNLILKPLNLAYMIQDEVLKITSKTRAEGRLEVVTYPVADLVVTIPQKVTMDLREQPAEPKPWKPMPALPAPDEGLIRPNPNAKANSLDFDSLTKLITATIEPNTWAEHGGNGSLRAYETTISLVVRQTPKVHEQLRELLEQLRQLQDLQVAFTVETIDVPDLTAKGLARLVTGKPVTLMPQEVRALKASLKQNESAKISEAPKVTLFNGQSLTLVLPSENKNGFGLDLSPVVSPDRRFVRMGLILNSLAAGNQLSGKQLLLKDGHSLLIDVSPSGGKTVKDPRKLSLITPRIIIQEEEEELLKADRARVGTVAPNILIQEEEEELLGIELK